MWPEQFTLFCGVTHEWMSSVFEVLFLYWFVVIFLLSIWDEIDVPVELFSDDALAAEDDKTGFLNVGVDFSVGSICKEDQYTSPWCKLVLKDENMIK